MIYNDGNIVLNKDLNKWECYINGRTISRTNSIEKTKRSAVKSLFWKEGTIFNVLPSFDQFLDENIQSPKIIFSVEERFGFIEQFVELISRRIIPSLVLTGSGGIGKTETVLRTLARLGKRGDVLGSEDHSFIDGDYTLIKGYSTAKSLYRTLWENNGKIIIFDDADSVHKDQTASNILKGALDSCEHRIITWGAEFSDTEEMPNKFEFTGNVIFISNLPIDKFPQALISRSVKVALELNTKEKIERIEYIINQNESFASDEEISDVLRFIKVNANSFTDLNLRSAMTVLKLRCEMKVNWERAALYTIMS